MKRLLPVLLLLFLLCACGKSGETPLTLPATEAAAETERPTETAVETEKVPGLLDNREAIDDQNNLYDLHNEAVESMRYQTILPFGTDFLSYVEVSSGEEHYELRLTILDGETGLPRCEKAVADVEYATAAVCGDHVAVMDEGTGSVTIYDDALQETGGGSFQTEWTTLGVDNAAKTAYAFPWDGGILTLDLETGEQGLLLEGVKSLSILSRQQDAVFFAYKDQKTAMTAYGMLDLQDGSLDTLPLPGDFLAVSRAGGRYLGSLQFRENAFLYGTAANQKIFVAEDCAMTLLADGNLLRSSYTEDSCTLTLYNSQGQFLSSCAVNQSEYTYLMEKPVWSSRYGGYLFTKTEYDNRVQLLFWDLSVKAAGEDLTTAEPPADPEPGQAVAAELYDRAAALGEEYGVTVLIADQCPTEYMTYSVVTETDYDLITMGLQDLGTALSAYPAGFFPQLLHDTLREIVICLTGPLTSLDIPEDSGGFTSFAAFVEESGDKIYMVMDLRQSGMIEENCYHEFSHMIDSRLQADALLRDDALFSEEGWQALNPPEFSYIYSYSDVPDALYSDGLDGYFIDVYARTFPTEDRARILEYAMSGFSWAFTEDSPFLRAKLQYYADCIRDGFDTTGWPETTRWEEPLR